MSPEANAVDAGQPLTYRVTALDYKGNLATAYTGPLHITTSDSAATVPGDFSLSNGTATFQMIFATKGLQSVTVTDPTFTSYTVTAPSVTVR
jgi:hypothetical protein